MNGQTKIASLSEGFINVLIGYGIALCAQLIIFPLFGGTFTLQQNLKIGGCFTLVSLVRQYILRRIFNAFTCRNIRYFKASPENFIKATPHIGFKYKYNGLDIIYSPIPEGENK